MIDREPAGRKFNFFKKAEAESSENFKETIGISNKAKVYFVIVALIMILCIVYVRQLRTGKGGTQKAADTAATQTTAEIAAETQEGATAAQAEKAAQKEKKSDKEKKKSEADKEASDADKKE